MLIKIIFSGLLILTTTLAIAQSPYNRNGGYVPQKDNQNTNATDSSKKKGFDPKKLVFGGNIGLAFGNETYVELSPLIGYRFTDKLTLGLGPKYQYYSITNVPGYANYSDQIYGGRLFGQYRLFNNIVAHAEYELVNTSYLVYNTSTGEYSPQRSYIPGLLLGGGFRQPIGPRSAFTLYILYNVLYQDGISPYPSPLVLSGGFLF